MAPQRSPRPGKRATTSELCPGSHDSIHQGGPSHRLDPHSGWGLFGHRWGPHLATIGDFWMAIDTWSGSTKRVAAAVGESSAAIGPPVPRVRTLIGAPQPAAVGQAHV